MDGGGWGWNTDKTRTEYMQTLKDYRIEGQARDAAIVALVRRHSVLTSELIQLALQGVDFGLPGTSRTVLLNRLTALAGRGYIHRLGCAKSGHLVYGIHHRGRGNHPQIEHDLIGARFGVLLDIALPQHGAEIAHLVSDQAELRVLAKQQEWPFVPDRTFIVQDVRYFCEFDNSTEGDDKIIAKAEAYKSYVRRERQRKEMLEKLGEKVNTMTRVLWIVPNEKRVEKL